MKNRRLIKVAVWSTVCLLSIVLMMITLYPVLERALYVAPVEESSLPAAEEPTVRPEPEALLLTAIYERDGNGKISAIYIEVFHVLTGNAYYMEVPVHTRVTLPTELYKKLQAYSPELPQYFKLSNMGDGFSDEYCLTGCNRILSFVLGVEIPHGIAAGEESLSAWSEGLERLTQRKGPPNEFLVQYQKWLESSEADLSMEERWMYYESYVKLRPHEVEKVPGAEGLAEYIVSEVQAKLRLQELMRQASVSDDSR